MGVKKQTELRTKLVPALFAKAKRAGISQEQLREEIAPDIIGCRISQATAPQILRLIDHITGAGRGLSRLPAEGGRTGTVPGSRYESSLSGLKEEVKDLAKERWGNVWIYSLNHFVRAFGVGHYEWLDITHAKAVKKRLIELQEKM